MDGHQTQQQRTGPPAPPRTTNQPPQLQQGGGDFTPILTVLLSFIAIVALVSLSIFFSFLGFFFLILCFSSIILRLSRFNRCLLDISLLVVYFVAIFVLFGRYYRGILFWGLGKEVVSDR